MPPGAPYGRLVVAANFTRGDAPLGIADLPWAHSSVKELWKGGDVRDEDLSGLVVPAKRFVLLGVGR